MFSSGEQPYKPIYSIPQYQFDVAYPIKRVEVNGYVVAPIICNNEVMPFIVVRVEQSIPYNNRFRNSVPIVEYQYGMVTTWLDCCYWAFDDEVMQENIERTMQHLSEESIRVLPLSLRNSTNGKPELRVEKESLKALNMEADTQRAAMQAFLDAAEVVAEVIRADRARIEIINGGDSIHKQYREFRFGR